MIGGFLYRAAEKEINTVMIVAGALMFCTPFIVLFAFMVRLEGWRTTLAGTAFITLVLIWLMIANYLVQAALHP